MNLWILGQQPLFLSSADFLFRLFLLLGLLMGEIFWLFPQELWLVSTEMPSNRKVFEKWFLEIQILHNNTRSKVEVSQDNVVEIFFGEPIEAGTVCEDVQRNWVSDTNTVSDLNKCSFAETIGN